MPPGSPPSLNRAQRDAVATLSGPVLVLAGAGTGKTRVITYRIAELIRSGIAPHRILAMTFTNKAAREMRERALALLGKRPRGTKPPEISTFHSLCVRILRRHARLLGYPDEFAIYDRGDQESLARSALRDVRVGNDKLRPGDLLALIGGWKNRGLSPGKAEDSADKDKEQLAALAYNRYQLGLKASGAMDFDDLLLNTEALFAQFPEARFAEASRFDHVLVDEYQDTNDLQYRILKSLADRHRNLCVVGDDDQSIYGWRGAEIAHILGFQRDWPEAKVIRLEENYRSTEPILKLANTLIGHNTARHPKTLRPTREGGFDPRFLRFEDEVAESEGIVREIDLRLNPKEPGPKVIPSDIAILFRTNEQPRAFELELRRAGIAYKLVGGLSFYDRREIRDCLAFLRVLANPSDEVSLLRTINLPPRGIGASSVDVLMKLAVERGLPLWAVLPEAPSNGDLAHGVGDRIEGFRRLIESFRARLGSEPLFKLASELIAIVDYKSEIKRIYREASDAESRWKSVEEFLNSIALYEQRHEDASLIGFLEETALAGRDDFKDDDERQPHAITLMTLHSAKGLEFPHVYLVGMEEGLLPHARSIVEGRGIDEERRLCYVGVTRAQSTLTMTFAKGRVKWGKSRPSIPSRFLMEMRGDTEKAQRAAAAAAALFGRGEQPGDGAAAEAAPAKAGRTKRAPGSSKAATPQPKAQSSKALSSASKRASS
jgi:DNA helicase-2/ATP-dependent DNA helicase PcrA